MAEDGETPHGQMDFSADPKAKFTKINLREDKMIAVMKDCAIMNAAHVYEGFLDYVKNNPGAKKAYTHLLDLVETKTKDQKEALPPFRGGRIPSLFDLLIEAFTILQQLALEYNLKVTLQTTFIKTKFIYVVYGKWQNPEEISRAGLDMVIKH